MKIGQERMGSDKQKHVAELGQSLDGDELDIM
jgi:hypothetical protein